MKRDMFGFRLRLWSVAAAAATALFVSACGASTSHDQSTASSSASSSAANANQCKTLRVLTWEGYADPTVVKPFEQQTGVSIKASYISSASGLVSKLANGGTGLYDIVTVSGDNVGELSRAGLIQPIETGKLQASHELLPFLIKPFATTDGKGAWAIPQDWGINPFLYNTSAIKQQPTSWNVLWDPKLKGKVGMYDDPQSLSIAAAVLGYDNPYSLSDDQLNAVKDKLLQLKPQVRALWSSGGDLIQLFANKEVDASLGWAYMYTSLKKKNFPIRQVIFPQHGGFSWADANALSKGVSGACKAAAYKWFDYLSAPKTQSVIGKVTGYSPVTAGATKYMTSQQIKETLMDDPSANWSRAIFITEPKDRNAYVKTWSEVKAGLK